MSEIGRHSDVCHDFNAFLCQVFLRVKMTETKQLKFADDSSIGLTIASWDLTSSMS